LVNFWEQDPEYVLSQVSRVRDLDFPFQPPTTSAYAGFSPWIWTTIFCSHFLFQELPTCAVGVDIKPTDRAVRTQDSLLPPHSAGFALNISSLKTFLENCQIP